MNINLNNVFLAEVWYVVNYEVLDVVDYGYEKEYYSKFLKSYFTGKRLVYKNDSGFYRDLKNGKKYDSFCTDVTGSYYVNEEKGLIPLKNIIKENMSKRKILKKLSNTSLYNKKEEDK